MLFHQPLTVSDHVEDMSFRDILKRIASQVSHTSIPFAFNRSVTRFFNLYTFCNFTIAFTFGTVAMVAICLIKYFTFGYNSVGLF